jgi:hypothetical protein
VTQIQIAALQSLLAMLQVVNAGYATVSKNLMVALILGGITAAVQTFLQMVGNATMSPLHQAQVDQAAAVMATQAAALGLVDPAKTVTAPAAQVPAGIPGPIGPVGPMGAAGPAGPTGGMGAGQSPASAPKKAW